MKELSIEEKAKRYDEAVNKLKIMHDDWSKTQNRAAKEVEEIFPELAEFEEERIRKGFIMGAKWQKEQIISNTSDAIIGLPYENKDGGYTHLIDVSRPLPVGNNKIAIIFKEDRI